MINKILNLKKNKKGFFSNEAGFTLIEMVVASSLFAVVMLVVTGTFQEVIEGQRNAMSSQNIQENMRYAFETMSKEMRIAQKDGEICYEEDKVYGVNALGDILYFKNGDGECVIYKINNDRLQIIRSGITNYITPDEIIISDLKFNIQGDPSVEQPKVTMKMKIKAKGKEIHNQEITLQTTVSARYYQ